MKHLSYKLLAAIVACSAAMLLNVNVHASTTQNQQPSAKRSHVVQMNKINHKQNVGPASKWTGHHYTYRNLRTVKNYQNATVRLGARHGRKNNRRAKNNRRQKQNKKQRNQKRPVKYRSPKLAKVHEKTINQKKPAFNHFKKSVGYVNNNQPTNFTSVSDNGGTYGDSDYARKGSSITANTNDGKTITFHRVTFIPKKLNNGRIMNQFYSPQGLVVAGRYAYVITNATNSYESSHSHDTDSNKQAPASYINGDTDTGSSPYGEGASQIIRIDLGKHVRDYNANLKAARRNIKVGSVFYGGHGQGLAYNPRTHQLWLLNNKSGQVQKTAVSLINPRTLIPQLRINFHTGNNTTIGDDLAFDRQGHVYNVTEAGPNSFASNGALKFFAGNINLRGKSRGIYMKFIKQALQWAPSDVIQGLTYNPKNNRLYVLGDDSVTSVPVAKLGRLQASDVWNTSFNSTREFEGLSFDNAGNGYLLVNRSPEILRSNYNKRVQF